MKYTKEQREKIKNALTKKDREKLKIAFGEVQARQYANGLKSVSPHRANIIASLLGKPGIIKLLVPALFSKSA